MMKATNLIALLAATLVFAATVQAVIIDIDMVPVGNPGNAPDTRYNSIAVGSVANDYRIGKYEVTAGQYTEFLNAVAKDDPNGLYNISMDNELNTGANIQRNGSSPNYSYSVAADWADRPVNYVSFWDAARFANWLDNGQPTGPQGPGTTEDGAYHDVGSLALFGRSAGARFFLPTEDEWYKAAYHDKTAGLAASYFDYPTGTNSVPGNNINETTNPGNNANFFFGGYTIGFPYFRTVAGEFELSDSPYGTFDQGGNVWEWNETVLFSTERGRRGGEYGGPASFLHASYRDTGGPTTENFNVGFRVASIPEPDDLGDYNHDGFVDAADYVVWRKGLGTTYTPAHFDIWRAHFGETVPTGTGAFAEAAVPEPPIMALSAIGLLVCAIGRQKRGQNFPSWLSRNMHGLTR